MAFRNDHEHPGQDSKFFLLLKKLERQGVIFPTSYRYFREEPVNFLSKNQETERNQSLNKIKEVNTNHESQIISKSRNFQKLIHFILWFLGEMIKIANRSKRLYLEFLLQNPKENEETKESKIFFYLQKL